MRACQRVKQKPCRDVGQTDSIGQTSYVPHYGAYKEMQRRAFCIYGSRACALHPKLRCYSDHYADSPDITSSKQRGPRHQTRAALDVHQSRQHTWSLSWRLCHGFSTVFPDPSSTSFRHVTCSSGEQRRKFAPSPLEMNEDSVAGQLLPSTGSACYKRSRVRANPADVPTSASSATGALHRASNGKEWSHEKSRSPSVPCPCQCA